MPFTPVTPISELTTKHRERYARHLTLPLFGELGQRRLLNAKVAVIGAGGLGAPALMYLAAAGIGEVTVIDPDLVDESNLQRQIIHGVERVGESKAESAAKTMRSINPDIQVNALNTALDSDNALEILDGHDVVLDGTDNFATRYLVSDACEILNLPLVWGSILAFDGQLSVFFADGGKGVTYRDIHPQPPAPGTVQNCAEAGVLGMLCGHIGTAMANEAIKVLTGIGETLYGQIALYDALSAQWRKVRVKRNPERSPITKLVDYQDLCGVRREEGGVAVKDLATVLAREECALVDIREPAEVAQGMLNGAIHLPMGELLADPSAANEKILKLTAGKTGLAGALLYCQGGVRSAAAQGKLRTQGWETKSLNGGYAHALRALPTFLAD